MPKGIPSSSSKSEVSPLSVRRIKRAPIDRIGIFRMTNTKKNDDGEEYDVDQVNLSIDWNSGHIQRNGEGEPVLDKDGNEQTHYINDGYITFSGDKRSNLVKILKALGFDTPEFIEQDGSNADGLRDDLDIQLVFGENGLGHDYEGADYDELPEYILPSKGGKQKKRDVEVPVLSFKINGQEVIGRAAELVITEKKGWNRIESYIPLDEGESNEPGKIGKPIGAKDDPPYERPDVEEREPDATTKAGKFVQKLFASVNLPREDWSAVARYMVGDPSIKNTASIPKEHAKMIQAMFKDNPAVVNNAYKELHKEDQEDDDFDDEDFDLDEEF